MLRLWLYGNLRCLFQLKRGCTEQLLLLGRVQELVWPCSYTSLSYCLLGLAVGWLHCELFAGKSHSLESDLKSYFGTA